MSTLANKRITTLMWYLVATIFLVIFGAIYEYFSHDVYSFFMAYSFIFPLIGGVLPTTIILLKEDTNTYRLTTSNYIYRLGIGTLTLGSLMQGVLDIYGTTNPLCYAYWIAGPLLLIIGITGIILRRRQLHRPIDKA